MSRAQDGAHVACIVASPPPLSTHPTLSGQVREAQRESPPLPPLPISNYCSFQRLRRISETASIQRSIVEKLTLDSYSIVIMFCFYYFLIGHLGAEILTAKVWWKSVKSWRAPIFLLTPIYCDFLAWWAVTTRQGQCGMKSAHISWPGRM